MAVMFGLTPLPSPLDQQGRRRYRASYLRLLRGWAYDNNGAEGAVLKGWVESRFGLVPTYHKEKITRFASSAWIRYVEEKMASRFHNL
jgi:NAD+---dinitrogen-reductase ADP-D-ribosyltransferase